MRRAGAHWAEDLGEVLVAAPRQADEVQLRARPGLASTQAIAWEDSSAGMMPSSFARQRWKAASASASVTAS